MSSEVLSRWPVLVSLPVAADECDEDGRLTEPGVERLFAAARSTYFDQCATVDQQALEVRRGSVRVGDAVGTKSNGVTVSVSVTEVFPDSFTMTARVRPRDRPGIAATASCSLSPGGAVPIAMRDEFIALAHGARHFH